MKRYVPFIIVAGVALVTLAGGTLLYRAKSAPALSIPGKGSGAAESVHIRGRPNAPVTLEEFGDFQCPPCGKLAGPIQDLEREYAKSLRVIFHNFPLITHQHAREAALAAEAAGLQGRFWEMHDILYREQAAWSKASDVGQLFEAYAGTIGLDVDRFRKDIKSAQVNARVTADQNRGASLGVTTTPTIFINNRAIPPPSLNLPSLHEAVEAALKAKASP
jgi:formate-nitrite transporter family protein